MPGPIIFGSLYVSACQAIRSCSPPQPGTPSLMPGRLAPETWPSHCDKPDRQQPSTLQRIRSAIAGGFGPSTLRSLCGVRLGDLLGLARGGYRRGSLAHLAAIQAGSLSGFRGEERGDPAAWLASASPDIGKRAADQRRSGTASAGTAQAIPARTADNTLGSPVTTPELTVTGTFRPQYRESQRHGRSCRVHQTHPGGQECHGHSPGRHPRDLASRAIRGRRRRAGTGSAR